MKTLSKQKGFVRMFLNDENITQVIDRLPTHVTDLFHEGHASINISTTGQIGISISENVEEEVGIKYLNLITDTIKKCPKQFLTQSIN